MPVGKALPNNQGLEARSPLSTRPGGRLRAGAGATLVQMAELFKQLGCREAMNLDGGGSSCLLVNGKETIKVSDKTGQRPVPAVFMIKSKK